MAKLKMFKDNVFIQEFMPKIGEEYLAGRAEGCSIKLDPERGISRQHFKLVFNGESWIVEGLSRYGELYYGGRKTGQIFLKSGDNFQVPPYDFYWEDETHQQADPKGISSGLDDEKTYVDVSFPQEAYLKVSDSEGNAYRIFRLEGQSWIAGRDTSCAIFIDQGQFSRRHFEIRKQEGAYVVKDLGSSNGTLLNGQPVSTQNWTAIHSGDVFSVGEWTLNFELRDRSFENRMNEIAPALRSPFIYESPVQPEAHPDSYKISEEVAAAPPPAWVVSNHSSPKSFKMNEAKPWIIRGLIAVLGIGGILFAVFDSPEKSGMQSSEMASKRSQTPFDKLSAEQRQYVKDTYRLADSLFKEGRYELARQEVAKIHQLIPFYEESKNIEKLAEVAIQTQIDQRKVQMKEQEQREMEEKIQRQVAYCRKKVNRKIEIADIDHCLSPVIALNPAHPQILQLKGDVESIVAERTTQKQRQADYEQRVARQRALYKRAESIDRAGRHLEALDAYEQVTQSSLPDPQNLRSVAERKIASIQQKMADRQAELEHDADAAFKNGDIKMAINILKKSLNVNPKNEVVKSKINSMLFELKQKMKGLYEEGILEESVGEVDSAKAKWKKIIQLSLPEEDYYKKARIKLKKYEAI